MLSHLFIKDFAIVQSLELDLESGFSVLTGETGAGKSILIDALAAALGERADKGNIRHGCVRAEVIAGFSLDDAPEARAWLSQQDLDEDNQCLLRRIIENDKSSRAYINGRPVPIQLLRELGELLVDIHGQHEHQSLLKRDTQRQLLDDYAGINDRVAELGNRYRSARTLQDRLNRLRQESSDRSARIELLQFQVHELEALGLGRDEPVRLEQEHDRLANGAELMEGAQAAIQTLYEDDQSISNALGHLISRLEQLGGHDQSIDAIASLLRDADIQISEAVSQLRHYVDDMDLDPQRLQWLDERIGVMTDLARKHRVNPDQLPDVLNTLAQELADVEDADNSLDRLEKDLVRAKSDYAALAETVSAARTQAAKKLSHAVSEHMQELGMPGGQFQVELAPLEGDLPAAAGRERVELLVSANVGQPAKALGKVASGGELSRISLALQVVLAGLGRIPTLIFDEVDVGVGGRVAEIVGTRLRDLGGSRQVLCITHLAQVASQGHHQLQVHKTARNGITETSITTLPSEARVQEIARMIGGIEISQQTLAHAEDMLVRAGNR
ncbi:MAG: DNA repair protein RecN [Gammaproteobacteria bacterium]|nr:DNA repair protein RecN [Gammaproteobacteria bacterium]